MSRPKGSKNKVKSTSQCPAIVTNCPPENEIKSPADLQAEQEYMAELQREDETLPAFLEIIDAEFASCNETPAEIMPGQSRNIKRTMLKLMSDIHGELAEQFNNARQATYVAFFRPEDKPVMESPNEDYYNLFKVA